MLFSETSPPNECRLLPSKRQVLEYMPLRLAYRGGSYINSDFMRFFGFCDLIGGTQILPRRTCAYSRAPDLSWARRLLGRWDSVGVRRREKRSAG